MKQVSVSKISKKDTQQTHVKPRIEPHRNLPFTYWVQSFNPKKAQLSYMVILSDDIVQCSCEAFKYSRGIMCKHLMTVINLQARWNNV